ncbi:MAG: hypothetical protein RR517_25650, partial [Pseudomonas sp.]
MNQLHSAEQVRQDRTTTPITIISEQHCWRTLGGLNTNDYFAYKNALSDGCHLQSASFNLRHPEEMICDLSNLEAPFDVLSAGEIIHIWNVLKQLTCALESNGVRRIDGDGLSPEIAISGPSKNELTVLKNVLLSKAAELTGFDKRPCKAERSRGLGKRRLLIDAKQTTIDFHNAFCAFYSQFVLPSHWEADKIFNTRFIYDEHPIWKQIEQLGTNKLFVLGAGLPLALSYLDSTDDRNVFFSEVHRQNDATLLGKFSLFEDIYPRPDHPQ